ncbi:MAG: anti-toxin [Neisseriales bacterium]|nr:MAG: anti-toxin [Neisseriales bacterium]
MEQSLVLCAKELHKSKSELVQEALSNYLEDIQDYISAKKVLARNEPTISHEDLKRELGL